MTDDIIRLQGAFSVHKYLIGHGLQTSHQEKKENKNSLHIFRLVDRLTGNMYPVRYSSFQQPFHHSYCKLLFHKTGNTYLIHCGDPICRING